jgi:hypothetical protein
MEKAVVGLLVGVVLATEDMACKPSCRNPE